MHGASKFWILRHVVVPTVLPDIMAGMRVGLGTAWLTIVAAELAGGISTGLGRMMTNYAELLQVPQVIVGMLLIGFIGFLMNEFLLAYREISLPLALAGEPLRGRRRWTARPGERAPKVEVDASHRYGDLVVHDHMKFAVAANEFVCICGPSGCGKTTLLDMLAGILKPSQGAALIDGKSADPKQQSISFVFQEPSTFPWLNVRDNVATGLKIKGAPQGRRSTRKCARSSRWSG